MLASLRLVSGCLLAALVFASCAPPASVPGGLAASDASILPDIRHRSAIVPGNYIKHVVFIVQENRSFDTIFAGFPGSDSKMYGYMHDGTMVPLRPIDWNTQDIPHGWAAGVMDYDNGKMDAFDRNNIWAPGQPPTYPYAYLKRSLVKPYWAMASRYTLADHMFPTEWGASFTAHLDLITGTTLLSSNSALASDPSSPPWNCDAPNGTTTTLVNPSGVFNTNGPFPCFTQFNSIATNLDNAGVSWKYYVADASKDWGGSIWSEFGAIHNVRYGPDWNTNIIVPQTNVLTDIANGKLSAVSWVMPDWADSDHPDNNSDTGPSWVASVVNAVGKSQYWNSTAIVILWDDWGGFYDDLPPPQLDWLGLGIRVPCIIVSPYAKAHYVSHTQYEFGSTLKLVEQVFSVPSLGYTDARANSMLDSFDFTRPPLKFVPVSAPYPSSFFMTRKPSRRVPDKE